MELLEFFGLQFVGDLFTFGCLIWLAIGAAVTKYMRGATKYYYRQYRKNQPYTVNFSAMFFCIVLWPVLLIREGAKL